MSLFIAVALFLIVGWIGASFYLSRRADPKLCGPGFIIRGIEKRGENPKLVPESLIMRESEEAIYYANLRSGFTWENKPLRGRWNRMFFEEIDTRAMIISEYLKDPSHEIFKSPDGKDNHFVKKFTEHGLIVEKKK